MVLIETVVKVSVQLVMSSGDLVKVYYNGIEKKLSCYYDKLCCLTFPSVTCF